MIRYRKWSPRQITGIVIVALIIGACFSPQSRRFFSTPESLRIVLGEEQEFALGLPFAVYIRSDREGAVKINGSLLAGEGPRISLKSPLAIEPVNTGRVSLEFRLFNVIPVRKLVVDCIPNTSLIPCGHAIGVIMRSQGVIVVGYSSVKGEDGRSLIPAKESGINIGDTILRINGQTIAGDSQVAELIDRAGQTGASLKLEVRRNGRLLPREVKPIRCPDTGRYRIGLYIRDGAAGVGTLTFYDPATLQYGALGHIIADVDTNQPITLDQGEIVAARISGIQPGKRGQPGEKMGTFTDDTATLGRIAKNTEFGITGALAQPLPTPYFSQPIPIASMSQVKLGPATIYTVVEGQQIEPFSIEISKIIPQGSPSGKGMILKVTDERLLDKTGGIVQGMSGSPIVQDGKLVGAVTHVFVNDPTRGYGVFVEWMLLQTEIGAGSQVGWSGQPAGSLAA